MRITANQWQQARTYHAQAVANLRSGKGTAKDLDTLSKVEGLMTQLYQEIAMLNDDILNIVQRAQARISADLSTIQGLQQQNQTLQQQLNTQNANAVSDSTANAVESFKAQLDQLDQTNPLPTGNTTGSGTGTAVTNAPATGAGTAAQPATVQTNVGAPKAPTA